MTRLEDDVVALMKKQVIDLAGCLGKTVKVDLNGQRIPVKSFLDYVNLYLQSASKARPDALPRIAEKVNNRWKICVSLTEGQFQQEQMVFELECSSINRMYIMYTVLMKLNV
ncbi:unnamed protein product [Camellia sinensis]